MPSPAGRPPGGLVLTLGLSQLICWGVSYYLIGVFGQAMASDLGWSLARVYAGFSLALVIEQHGAVLAACLLLLLSTALSLTSLIGKRVRPRS